MASIDRHPPRPGDPRKRARWRARWRDPDGKQRTKVFDRKVDAEAHVTALEHRKRRGEYIDPDAGRITVREWCEAWRLMQAHRPSTMAQVESHFRLHLYPVLGRHELRALRPSEVQGWVTGMTERLAPRTTETVYRHFASSMNAAARDRLIGRTPCEAIKLPKPERAEVVPPTVEQVAAIADAIYPRYRCAVILAAGSGLRLGEVFGLHVDRIDFLRRTVRVDQQLLTPNRGPCYLGPPKSDASVRTVPVAEVVINELARHLQQFPAVDEFVFTTDDGALVRRPGFTDLWRRAVKRAAIEERITFHGLRHHYASALIAAGCSVKAVQKALGHGSASETLDTYSHLWPDDEDRTRQAIQTLWAPPAQDTADPSRVTVVSQHSMMGSRLESKVGLGSAENPAIWGFSSPEKLR